MINIVVGVGIARQSPLLRNGYHHHNPSSVDPLSPQNPSLNMPPTRISIIYNNDNRIIIDI